MRIEEFQWDDANVAKVQLRQYVPEQLDTVLDARYVILRNKRGHAGTHRVVGRTVGGELVTIVVVATGIPGVWRPITAWPGDAEEQAHASRYRI